jgi:hypothetical protein
VLAVFSHRKAPGATTAITQLGKTIEVFHRRRCPRSGDDIIEAVCGVCTDTRTSAICVDEIHKEPGGLP